MPKDFEDCVKQGGRMWTEKLPNNKYRHVCRVGGKNHYGHIKTKKEKKTNGK